MDTKRWLWDGFSGGSAIFWVGWLPSLLLCFDDRLDNRCVFGLAMTDGWRLLDGRLDSSSYHRSGKLLLTLNKYFERLTKLWVVQWHLLDVCWGAVGMRTSQIQIPSVLLPPRHTCKTTLTTIGTPLTVYLQFILNLHKYRGYGRLVTVGSVGRTPLNGLTLPHHHLSVIKWFCPFGWVMEIWRGGGNSLRYALREDKW